MIDLNRTTAEIVAEIRDAARAGGTETEAAERWEGDGVWEVWPAGRKGGLDVAGNDTRYAPAVNADAGDGEPAAEGAIKTLADAVAWLAGR